MAAERDYVLGTHDEELERLGLQHRVWRPRALDAWRRAGITAGQTVLDVGCGPGYAALDLAEIVGPSGRVVAVDRSRRFLDALERSRNQRGLVQIETHEKDLDVDELPSVSADVAWARWVFMFLRRPKELLRRVAEMIRPGGVFVAHEYFEYCSWKLIPRCPEHEELVRVLVAVWRAEGGEPDVARDLAAWLPEFGFRLAELRTIVDVVPPTSPVWRWPGAFIEVGLRRLVDLGRFSTERASEIAAAFRARESDPRSLMVTPAVLEILAVKE